MLIISSIFIPFVSGSTDGGFYGCYKMPYSDEKCFIFKDKFEDSHILINNYVWYSKIFPLTTFKTSYNSSELVDYVCPIIFNLSYQCNFNCSLIFENETLEINGPVPPIYEKSIIIVGKNLSSIYSHNGEGFYYKIENSKLGELELFICSNLTKSDISQGTIDIFEGEENKTYLLGYKKTRENNLNDKNFYTIGPQVSLDIKIKELFTGSILKWTPDLPYAEIALKICPTNKSYDKNETLNYNYISPSGITSDKSFYDVEGKCWNLHSPNSNTIQVHFDYDSWYFPISKYETKIIFENNISMNKTIPGLRIPGSEFLSGSSNFEKNEITIEVINTWQIYLLLGFLLVPFYSILLFSFKKVISKQSILSWAYWINIIPPPFAVLNAISIIPFWSILSLITWISFCCLWGLIIYNKKLKRK
jgi:hypothetical protein